MGMLLQNKQLHPPVRFLSSVPYNSKNARNSTGPHFSYLLTWCRFPNHCSQKTNNSRADYKLGDSLNSAAGKPIHSACTTQSQQPALKNLELKPPTRRSDPNAFLSQVPGISWRRLLLYLVGMNFGEDCQLKGRIAIFGFRV